MKVIGITPARGGSKGIHRKNVKLLAGKPLLQYTIETAQSCPLIDRYVVNTEDEEIKHFAESQGVETQGRPEEFWHDNTFQEVDRLLYYCVDELEKKGNMFDVVVLLYATSPFRQMEHITDCIDLVLNGGYDSALTLKEDRSYIWERTGKDQEVFPVNYDPKKRGPNQLEGWNQWVENKAVYVMKRDLLMDTKCRLGGRIGYVEISKMDSIDIDTPDDFMLAEYILTMRNSRMQSNG